ncbi:Vitamin B12 transporter BtuB [Oligella sp. MSHR50489EDL]|uniref:TonB-dependent hemoglobin/transferrin/lactoferrin family receptor n=1 Tax=Oligella sp. MSHR50489EDL TaxID=3139409 RepID=UPI003D819157
MKRFNKKVLSLSLLGLWPIYGVAQEAVYELGTINVDSSVTVESKKERISRAELDKEIVTDVRDLGRYTSDLGIVDDGRHIKGFSMRGVEGNRIGISIDNVALPEYEENSLYARYGNFNNSRMVADTELITEVEVTKGGESFSQGGGNLGGGINFRTLNAQDFVNPNRSVGALARTGYNSKNKEWYQTLGLGYLGEDLDAVLLYTHRRARELKSNGDITITDYDPKSTLNNPYHGKVRQIPDPAEIHSHSYLAKVNWAFLPNHKIGFSVNGSYKKRLTDEYSYGVLSNFRSQDDQERLLNTNMYYEWRPESVLDTVRLDLAFQRTDLAALSDLRARKTDIWREKPLSYGHVEERKDRRFKTNYKRIELTLQTKPWEWGNTSHQLSLKGGVSRRHFENINADDFWIQEDGTIGKRYIYTIQYPTVTRNRYASLLYNVAWKDVLAAYAGIRYDDESVTPRDLNAECSQACVAMGKPNRSSFHSHSNLLGLNLNLTDTWSLAYQLSTGYRVPTASEMFFTFEHPAGSWFANPDLKPERSLNHVWTLSANHRYGYFDLSYYQNRYRNFLYEMEVKYPDPKVWWKEIEGWQMVNVDKAKVYGWEFKGMLDLHTTAGLPDGLSLFASAAKSRGTMSNGASMLSIQPLKLVVGLDYHDPEDRWGIYTRLSYNASKKPQDAQHFDARTGKLKTYDYLNNSYTVLDVFGFVKPIKNLTIRGGLYNVFNRKYHTWDTLRSINPWYAVSGSVGKANSPYELYGAGLQRFVAPGRNVAISLEYKF